MTKTVTLVIPTTTIQTDAATAATPFVWSLSGSDGTSLSPQTSDPTVSFPAEDGVTYTGQVTKAGLQLSISFTVPAEVPVPVPPPAPSTVATLVPDTTQAVQVSFA